MKSEGFLGRKSWLFNFFFIFVIHGVVSGIIAGGVEFAVAYGMYYKNSQPVLLWGFPNTLSGDCALSLFIQVGVTWACEEILVGWDCYLENTPVLPFEIELPDETGHKLFWRLFEVKHGIFREDRSFRSYIRKQFVRYPNRTKLFNLFAWFVNKLIISMITAAMIWFWVWPVTMGILAGIGTKVGSHDYQFHGWAPQIMKLIYGFVLGLMSSPLAIIVILLRDNWHLKYRETANITSTTNEKGVYQASANDTSTGDTNVEEADQSTTNN